MIPEKRVRKALLNVEKKQILDDLAHINAAILHLLNGGKDNYDTAKNSKAHKKQIYNDTSDKIFLDLQARRQEQENRLNAVSRELNSLEKEE